MVSRVILTKPAERGNMKRARVIQLINEFSGDLEQEPTQCQFKVAFKNVDSDLRILRHIIIYLTMLKENTIMKKDI